MNGERTVVLERGGVRVVVMDSVSFATAEEAGDVLVTGSHGGRSAGEYAARCGCRCLVANDAGIGRNAAGVRGIEELDAAGIAGIAVGHGSARIGDGADVWRSGVVTFANATARAAGVVLGSAVPDAVGAVLDAGGAARDADGADPGPTGAAAAGGATLDAGGAGC